MLGKLPDRNQREIFRTQLEDLIDPHHSLALLANAIDWKYFENEFKICYLNEYNGYEVFQNIFLSIFN